MDEYFLKDVFEAAVHLVKTSGGKMDPKAAVKQAFEEYEADAVKRMRASAHAHMASGKLAHLVAESAAGRIPTVDFSYDRIRMAHVDPSDTAWKAPKLDPGVLWCTITTWSTCVRTAGIGGTCTEAGSSRFLANGSWGIRRYVWRHSAVIGSPQYPQMPHVTSPSIGRRIRRRRPSKCSARGLCPRHHP